MKSCNFTELYKDWFFFGQFKNILLKYDKRKEKIEANLADIFDVKTRGLVLLLSKTVKISNIYYSGKNVNIGLTDTPT